MQLIFAGKAHPHDEPGKQVMQTIVHFTRLPEFRGKVVFLPGYGIALARTLVAGCDVWLSNGRIATVRMWGGRPPPAKP